MRVPSHPDADKLLAREIKSMRELKARLAKQLAEFEERYVLKLADFVTVHH